MSIKEGYQEIPDVEAVDVASMPQKIVLKPQDLYPEADSKEAELLGILDSIINGMSLELSIPYVDADNLPLRSLNFSWAVFLPFVSGTILGTAACTFIGSENQGGVFGPVSFSCITVSLFWLNTVVPVSSRMCGQASYAIELAQNSRDQVQQCLENGVNVILHKVMNVHSKLESVLQTMSPELSTDSSLEIAGLKDALAGLEVSVHELKMSAAKVKDMILVSQEGFIPLHLQSASNYRWRIVIPILALCFALQAVILAIALFVHMILTDSTRVLFDSFALPRLLRTLPDESFVELNKNNGSLEVMKVGWEPEEPQLLSSFSFVITALSFFVAITQIGVVYLFTGAQFAAGLVNKVIDSILEATRQAARAQGLYGAADSVFVEKMSIIKSMLLQAIVARKFSENCDDAISSEPQKGSRFRWFGIGKS